MAAVDPPIIPTAQELRRKVWEAANILRGSVDASDYKNYIFPLLFFRRISDIWSFEQRRDLAAFQVERPLHPRFDIPVGCHWEDLRKVFGHQGETLQRMLGQIERANPNTLGGIFGSARWDDPDHLPEINLRKLLDLFSGINLDPELVPNDVMGNVYEYLLMQFAENSGQHAEAFFTPRGVTRLLMRLMEPQEGESIYDPTCGSGGMLIEAVEEIREAGGKSDSLRVFGQELNPTTAAIARMNLYFHEFEEFDVRRGDTLRHPAFVDPMGGLRTFDVVVANPPYSVKNWGEEGWATDHYGRAIGGVPPNNSADLAWVQHMVKSMKPGRGRAAVVMPHGPLFRGNREGKIRQWLIESGYLDAVLDIPRELFYRTTIPNSVWVLRADKRRDGKVLIIQAKDQCHPNPDKKPRNIVTVEDVETIVTAYRTAQDNDKTRVVEVSLEELERNGWDLNIGRYIRAEGEEVPDVATCEADLRDALGRFDAARTALFEQLERAV